ncbi:hypothetical protein INP83_11540 [Mucilaginibacter sp. 21P]|uniref:MauE/DoxX family redox-associated membrane protein n=1 Tax=Mucilaginibacter sp. 21P TaxID=2778902 RepID=UPI001C574A86|nr:MauE/DoxX family redox-associated membrane protein [Mucilaginibacter sp. 21P]QXV63740.1 hypothetical protein INP83_11540 [Mucilaginibacter sp. 21P]
MNNLIKQFAPSALILLFAYAAASKWLAIDDFYGQLYNQSFPHWLAEVLWRILIPLELLTAVLLSFIRTQRLGLWLATILMAAFTLYVLLVLLHFWKRIPCSCGGVLGRLSWGSHLVFNSIFLAISASALWLSAYDTRDLG